MKVVLLHAWPHEEWMWNSQVTALKGAGFRVETPRLYGRGPSIDGWAAQILRDDWENLVAVGASMGGYCALALARRAPERVLGLVLAGARAGIDSMERRKEREALISNLRAHRLPPEELGSIVPPEDLVMAQEAIRDRLDLTGVVASFGGPLLVCVGDQDEFLSVDEARELAGTALQGSVEVFEEAGHLVSLDQPQRFNEVLLRFVEQWR
jgi:pimeloyl-ACP methyl ester carboxylesterase